MTAIRTLRLSTGAFDHAGVFALTVMDYKKQPKRITVSLHKGKERAEDGIYWAMKQSAMVKQTYTEEERAALDRVQSETPVDVGSLVRIEGEPGLYRVRVQGDYSDAAVFIPVEA